MLGAGDSGCCPAGAGVSGAAVAPAAVAGCFRDGRVALTAPVFGFLTVFFFGFPPAARPFGRARLVAFREPAGLAFRRLLRSAMAGDPSEVAKRIKDGVWEGADGSGRRVCLDGGTDHARRMVRRCGGHDVLLCSVPVFGMGIGELLA